MRQPGFPRYAAAADYPPLVWAAVEASRETGCERACTPEFGRLLRVLAGGHLRIGETGTACGVGAGWIVSGLRPGASLVTAELEPRFAEAAARVLGAAARVLRGDWAQIREFAPFDLLFCDHGADKGNPTPMLELLAPDGLLVLDDLTPEAAWTDELGAAYPAGDPLRQAWAALGDVAVAEVLLTPTESALLVQRIGKPSYGSRS